MFDDANLNAPEEISNLFDDLEEDDDWAADILITAEIEEAEPELEPEPEPELSLSLS